MSKNNIWLILLLFSCSTIQGSIEIREACMDDLAVLQQIDHEVTYEYVKPLYLKAYSHLCIGKDPDFYLAQKLNKDIVWFEECILSESTYSIYLALDARTQDAAGLIVVHKENETSLLIDLLLVRKKYRYQGAGKGLVRLAISSFTDVCSCIVYIFGCPENQNTLNFYKSVGFKDLGPADIDKKAYGVIPYRDLLHYLRLNL